jgi:hypothetical protein
MNFRSVDHALRFAYSLADRPICKTSSLGAWRGKERGGDELTPYDRRAQAVMIQNCVARLPATEKAYIHVKYANMGEKWDGRLAVVEWMQQQAGDISLEAHRLMLEQYITGSGSARELGLVLGARKSKALATRRDVFARLDSLHRRAIGQLEEYFIRAQVMHLTQRVGAVE